MTINETVLYGRKNWEDLEDLIIATTDLKELEKAERWASDNGFVFFRRQAVDLNKAPDFAGAVN